MTVGAIIAIAVGTYALRVAGPLLRDRFTLPERADEWIKQAAAVLLVAVIATAALTKEQQFAGWALPCGVAVGGIAAWRRAPFIVVVISAGATTALLRLLGVP